MLHKSIKQLQPFLANDLTDLIEVLHPKNDDIPLGYSLAHASLDIGKSSLPHILKECSELYYFLKGKAKVVVGKEEKEVEEGEIVLVPAGATQYVVNQGDVRLEFLCIVSPAWYAEQDEVVQKEY